MAVLETLEHLSLLECTEIPPLRPEKHCSVVPENIFAVKIDGVHTDFVISDFRDRVLIIITQLGNIGTLVSVTRDPIISEEVPDDLYSVKTVFGSDNEEKFHLIARFVYQHTSLSKPALFALGLKNISPRTARAIGDTINHHKTW